MNQKILVVGSSNTDMVIKAAKFALPGETILGGEFFMNPGGKGANQAIAASRLGGDVTFVGKVGSDIFGRQALQQLTKENIETRFVIVDHEYPSGVALINVDSKGQNCIVVAPGANGQLQPADIDHVLSEVPQENLVLVQLEIPIDTVTHLIRKTAELGNRLILNPAPAQNLPNELFASIYTITPNETEIELLTGIRVKDIGSAKAAGSKLLDLGVQQVIITLGSQGAYLHTSSISKLIAAPEVTAVDTTAAGDCFNGALAVALAEDMGMESAVHFACRAAAISVTRMGAQQSIPYRKELQQR
ncbi:MULTISPECIES: ribokinase [Olivibacter]|uniref:Ribokinase n=1 Tax=Olivibacter jilunii TaxID=985016 RepID=A0ABW6B4U4_9SPHI|nr:ribokinase [Pseudosphingobacterium sp.]